MDSWQQYLYRRHSEDELAEWAKRLRDFRFCRALGGHANDGDQLVLALKYSNAADLENVWRELGVSKPLAGPVELAGVLVFVAVWADRVLLMLSGSEGDPFEVTAADVANAETLEAAIDLRPERKIDPPLDSKHCISPKHYPDIWRTA